jgi:site-specific DNA recombinase
MTMRWRIYCRLSRDRSGLSENVEIQLEECQAWAAERGDEVVGVFTDNDISASKYAEGKERPGYDALLKEVRADLQPNGVLVTEMPRLYRRLEELLELIHLAEPTALRMIQTTSDSGYDLSTGAGIHNAVSAVNNAVLESRKISERTKRKKKAQAKAGVYSGGPRPYGYRWIPAVKDGSGRVIEPGRMEMVEPEADVIREATRRRLAGESLNVITDDFNQRKIPSATGKLWHAVSLRQILRRPRIKGILVHNGMEYPAQWEAIIDPETWERLQLIFESEDHRGGGKHASPRSYLLTGICVCGECGGPMVGSSAEAKGATRINGESSVRRYYCVPRDNRGVKRGCGKVARIAEPIERLVTAAVLDVLDSPEMGRMLAAASENNEMRTLVDQYEGQKLKMNELIEDYASGLLNRDQLAHAKSIVESAMEETKRRMEKIQAGSIFRPLPPGTSIRQAWKDHEGDLHWRRSLINMLVEKVIVRRGRSGNTTWKDPNSEDSWRFDYQLVEIAWRGAKEQSA